LCECIIRVQQKSALTQISHSFELAEKPAKQKAGAGKKAKIVIKKNKKIFVDKRFSSYYTCLVIRDTG